jgi:hypothetical protein
MRPIRNEGGRMIETCYLCERETKQENDSTVIEKLRKRGRDREEKRADLAIVVVEAAGRRRKKKK